jgi:soluble P-type ATPase
MKTTNKKIEKLKEVNTLINKMLVEMEASVFIASADNIQEIKAKRELVRVVGEPKQ